MLIQPWDIKFACIFRLAIKLNRMKKYRNSKQCQAQIIYKSSDHRSRFIVPQIMPVTAPATDHTPAASHTMLK